MASISAEEARAGRRARMMPAAAARADVLLGAARTACEALREVPAARVLDALAPLGETGTQYDEWQTTLEEVPAQRLFADAADLKTALETNEPRALAVALGVLAQLDATRTYALIRDALPLESTHFAPNYLEAYVQRALEPVVDRILAATPPDDFAEMFASGRLHLERIPAGWVARLGVEAIGAAVCGSALGYLHREDAETFLAKHPAWHDPEALTELYRSIGGATSHAACAFNIVLVDRLLEARYLPAADVAAALYAANADAEAGPRSLIAQAAFRLLVALRHRPTLERVYATLDARTRGKRLGFDAHHTRPELRGPIAAGFAIDPATASSRLGAWLVPKAVASEHGAAVAHDILRAGLGVMTDHDGTRLASGHGSFIDADPGWRELLEALAKHPRLGKLVRGMLADPSKSPAKKKAATKKSTKKKTQSK